MKKLLLITMCISLTACAGFDSPPPCIYKLWSKKGVSEEEIKRVMVKECGYDDWCGDNYLTFKMTDEEYVKSEICMKRKGFSKYKDRAYICYQKDPRTKIPQACYEATDVIPEWWVDMSKRKWYQ